MMMVTKTMISMMIFSSQAGATCCVCWRTSTWRSYQSRTDILVTKQRRGRPDGSPQRLCPVPAAVTNMSYIHFLVPL